MAETFEPGDILLLLDDMADDPGTNLAIRIGEHLAAFSPWRKYIGKASVQHVAIWVKDRPLDPDIAEADDRGIIRVNALGPGTYLHYRARDKELGQSAAKIALEWALPHAQHLSRPTASISVPRWGARGSYCSQFVASAYQAAGCIRNAPFCGLLMAAASIISRQELYRRLVKDDFHFTCEGDVTVFEEAARRQSTLPIPLDAALVPMGRRDSEVVKVD